MGSEGKGDAWIAHALGTSPGSIQSFRSRRRIPTQAIRGGRVRPRPLPGIETDGAGPRYEGVIEREAGGRVGLWMDPAVSEEAAYRKYWADRRKVSVRISGRRVVIGADDGAWGGAPPGPPTGPPTGPAAPDPTGARTLGGKGTRTYAEAAPRFRASVSPRLQV